MKAKKVELKDTMGVDTLLPKTSLELMNNKPFSVVGGTVQIGDREKFLYIDSPTITKNAEFANSGHQNNLSINGYSHFVAGQSVKIGNTAIGEERLNNRIMENLPGVLTFGLIRPKNSNYAKGYKWIFGMRLTSLSEGTKSEVYGYCVKQQAGGYLVPSDEPVLLTDIDKEEQYTFVPLCSRYFIPSDKDVPA